MYPLVEASEVDILGKINIINVLYNMFVCGLSESLAIIITLIRMFWAGLGGINGCISLCAMTWT